MKSTLVSDRWAALAGLRWFLALIVVGVHFDHFFGPGRAFYMLCGTLGSLAAVMGFFLISGYSIAASITARPQQYAQRRFNRIAPVYYLGLLLALLPYLLFGPHFALGSGYTFDAPAPRELLLNAIMLGTLACHGIATYGVIWTLAIEWWLYMLAPLLVRKGAGLTGGLCLASALVYVVGPYRGYAVHSENVGLYNFAAVSWAWLLGWLFYFGRSNLRYRIAIVVVPACLLCLHDTGGGPLSPLTVAVVGLTLICCERLMLPRLWARALNYLGALSYPLYLCHVPCGIVLALLFERHLHRMLPIPLYLIVLLLLIAAVHWLEVCAVALLPTPPAARPTAPREDLGLPEPVQHSSEPRRP